MYPLDNLHLLPADIQAWLKANLRGVIFEGTISTPTAQKFGVDISGRSYYIAAVLTFALLVGPFTGRSGLSCSWHDAAARSVDTHYE